MHIMVEIAGHAERWHFASSRATDTWLSGEPWLRRGGCRQFIIGSAVEHRDLIDAIRRSVRGIDQGRSGVRVIDESLDSTDSIEAVICDYYELSREGSLRARLRRLGEAMVKEPRCFVFCVDEMTPDIVDQAESLCELTFKQCGRGVVILLVCVGSNESGSVSFDYRSGHPIQGALDEVASSGACWRAYLHLWLGWEAAGRPRHAARWGQRCAEFAIGDERRVLEVLEEAALDVFGRIDGAVWDAIGARNRQDRRLMQVARSEGILWRPPGTTHEVLAPWARRALALRGFTVADAHLACDWVNRELLGGSLEIERRVRSIYGEILARIPAPAGAHELVRKLTETPDSLSARMLRSDALASAPHPWQLASFGEVLRALKGHIPRELVEQLHEVRAVRNGAAHGHALGWRATLGMTMARQSLSRF